jgi:hydroxyacylglutathione hydrolase
MIVERIETTGLAQVSYIIADEAGGEIAVIDPRRDVDVYIDWANAHSGTITAILETHIHADFISGAWELHHATGAPVYASRQGQQNFDHLSLDDHDRVRIGYVELEARRTPGHTPEHLVYLLIDPGQDSEPIAMFSGDLLFVGEVGRPDLHGEGETRPLAEQLFETFFERIAALPDDLTVYPGHTGGSSCGKNIGDAPQTTLGAERQYNYALQHTDKEAFIQAVLEGMPDPPTYYPILKSVNKTGPALLATLQTGAPLTADEVEGAMNNNAVLLDARSEAAFDRANISGSFYAGDRSSFINWIGWLAPYDKPLVLLLNRDEKFDEVVTELRRIGLDQTVSYLQGGIDAWIASGRSVQPFDSILPEDLRDAIENFEELAIVDVRSEDEWNDGHIDWAVHHFVGDIASGEKISLDRGLQIVLACATGYRSRVAASVLQGRGYPMLLDLEGGMNAWNELGLPVESDPR